MKFTTSSPAPSTAVNYTTVLTPAQNQLYISTTQLPSSLSNLIKNNVLVQVAIVPDQPDSKEAENEITTTITTIVG